MITATWLKTIWLQKLPSKPVSNLGTAKKYKVTVSHSGVALGVVYLGVIF